MELDKICRLCLTIKKDMRNIYTDNIVSLIEDFCTTIKIENNPGWPSVICIQCLHQVSRCHSFKKRIEKSDSELKQYIKSLTVVVEEPVPVMKEMRVPEIKQHQMQQQQIQEIQIQRPDQHPLIMLNNSSMMNGGQQLIQTANGQIIQAQIGQFIQGPNNTIQMITTNPTNVCTTAPQHQQHQLLQLRTEPENRCELIVQPSDMSDSHFFEEIPVVVQSANGQQTILNLPHHQVQALQQQIAQSANNNQQQQVQIQQINAQQVPQNSCSSETDEIEIHEVQEFDDFGCDDMEEIANEDDQETETTSTTYIVQTIQEESSENSDDDKQLLAEFLAQQTHSEPGRHVCNLCNQEFKHVKWLHSHMKSIHINWIKANCKKQPQCSICFKSFRGPGMLKMHMKTHEKENKLPTCSICSKEFKSKSILYRHRATHFSNQKQHRCAQCDKNFSSNYQLNQHMQRHKKNQQCLHCEKKFSSASDLQNHVQQHLGISKDDGDKSDDDIKSS